MARRNGGIDKAAHIKHQTVGKSNEVSYDVLDAARQELNKEKAKSKSPRGAIPAHVPLVSLRFLNHSDDGAKGGVASGAASASTPKAKKNQAGINVVSLPSQDSISESLPSSTSGVGQVKPQVIQGKQSLKQQDRTSGKAFSASLASSEAEVERRKSRRRTRRRLRVVAAVAVVAALVAAGLFLYRGYQDRQENIMQIDAAIDLLSGTDESLAELNRLVQSPFENVESSEWIALSKELPSVEEDLRTVISSADALSEMLTFEDDVIAAKCVSEAATVRCELLDQAVELFDEAKKAKAAADAMSEAWATVAQADDAARTAAEAVASSATGEDAQAARAGTQEAYDGFVNALAQVRNCESLYENVDLSEYIAYLEKRIEALSCALASDDALVARNKEEARVQNEAYAAADAEAARMAASLPADETQPIREAFESNTEKMRANYAATYEQVDAADNKVRDYLGSSH